jgi:5-(carboxyamino)imidazole ribonucleotide mutase
MGKDQTPKSKKPKIAVLMGSSSDKDIMEACIDGLNYFGISHEVYVMSAHRNPDIVDAFATDAEKEGFRVIIAGAGMAAHLPGVVAARTTIPVIGVPLEGSALGGRDALYSMVQMPTGIPVATVSIGKAGARNAAVLAAEILALQDKEIKQKLLIFRKKGSKF